MLIRVADICKQFVKSFTFCPRGAAYWYVSFNAAFLAAVLAPLICTAVGAAMQTPPPALPPGLVIIPIPNRLISALVFSVGLSTVFTTASTAGIPIIFPMWDRPLGAFAT